MEIVYLIDGNPYFITSKNNLHRKAEIPQAMYLQKKSGLLNDTVRFLKELGYTVKGTNRHYVDQNPGIEIINLDDA